MDRSPSFPFSVDEKSRPEPVDGVHRAIYQAAVTAADAYLATRLALRVEGGVLRLGNRFLSLPRYREIAMVAVGHAASSQALAATHALGARLTQGYVAGPDPLPPEVPFRSAEVPRGGLGTRAGEEAARTALELASGLGEGDLLIALVSAGALASLALPPTGWTGPDFSGWLAQLSKGGATSREATLAAAAVGAGGLSGGLALAAARAEVAAIVLDRGDGGAAVGGSPTRRLTDAEREEALRAIDRTGRREGLPTAARASLEGKGSLTDPLPGSVDRPVVVTGPSDALRGAGDAASDRKYWPRLARVSLAGTPWEVARRFVERLDEILAAEPSLLTAADHRGLAVLGSTTFEVPEGGDERAAIAAFLSAAQPRLRHRGTTVSAFATSGAPEAAPPPGFIVEAGAPGARAVARPLRMRAGITDVGCVVAALVPSQRERNAR